MTELGELPTHLPKHVAIIMDGNGRWAKKRYLPREAGHYAGMSAVRETVRAGCDLGLENLTLFAFSSENWKRPKTEVGALMGLFRAYFRSDMDELVERNVRMRIIGHRGRVASDIQQMIHDAESRTAGNSGMNLTFAFDYGGQEDAEQQAQHPFTGRAHRVSGMRLAHAHAALSESSAPKRRARPANLLSAAIRAARSKSGHSVSRNRSSA